MSKVSAQEIQIKGIVSGSEGEILAGASVTVEGTTLWTTCGVEGTYSINVPDSKSVLVFSYLGYKTARVVVGDQKSIDLALDKDFAVLDEAVMIGYSFVKKKDLTGAIAVVGEKDFQKGVSTPDRLIMGKVAGVQVTPGGGAPGSGSRIRIRGGASLTASNDPLIIIDGTPLENSSVAGSPSLLSTINPADIESMNILKDASATAIYGSRASNGIIIITTKQARYGQKTKIDFSTRFSLSALPKALDILSASQIVEIVNSNPLSTNEFKAMLGTANTDWQSEIYQTAIGTDNNITIAGASKNMPYRLSFGYLNENGVLKSGNIERITSNVNLNPRYFEGKLKIDIGLKFSNIDNKIANTGAIEGAMGFDPSKPVRTNGFDKFGGYYTWLLNDGNVNSQAFSNPVALLETYDNRANILRGIATAQIDYRLHFLPELRANMNVSYDYAQSRGNTKVPDWASYMITRGGQNTNYGDYRVNKLFEFYFNYSKNIKIINSFIDLTAGHTYQDWLHHQDHFQDYTADGRPYGAAPAYPYDENRHTLISFFGRLNYTLMDRYLLAATFRRDGSSRFHPDFRWGNFSSIALAWRISEENFLKNVTIINDLKLRLGYGETGQQDIGSNYGYIPYYRQSSTKSQYQFGNELYMMYRPEAYNTYLKWENTVTWNIALDYALFNNRLSGSVDFYRKKTSDLLNNISVPSGSNFSDKMIANVGNIENRGVEFSMNIIPIQNKNWTWEIAINLAYNKNEITKLTPFNIAGYKGVQAGWMDYASVQMQSVGYPLNSFYLWRQVYDNNGNPLEGVYADLDRNGVINEEDKTHLKSAEPNIIGGFSTSLSYKKWTLGTVFRASFGNYVYNGINATYGTYGTLFSSSRSIVNVPANVLKTGFQYQQQYSDYYLENASFLKMDNLTLSYDFGKVFNNLLGIRGSFEIQNLFTLTKYSGPDPEITDGIDRKFYLRPRIFALNFNFSF
ncbi:MAG: SusC/RagA family TonB-linked outer membrane protein [Prevotellaceae bacterium]|nr:SusC/RagA family TonB-linked outer membrane protein [Prevotellaceae bacterium]